MHVFEIFSTSTHYNDMTILKIFASNFKHFRIHGIFIKWQIGYRQALADLLNTTFSLINFVSNKPWYCKFPGYVL